MWRAGSGVKGLAMNGPTKIVGPPWTPLPARKASRYFSHLGKKAMKFI